jgi:competence protein ComEC
MKKAQLIILIVLAITVGMLFYIKKDDKELTSEVQGEKLVQNDFVKVTFLDVGQGDATFIEFQDGEQMLVDCSQDARVVEALGRVMPYYDHEIDYLMITHPDLDHYGGCVEVMNRFDVKNIVYNGLKKENDEMWTEFWQAIQNEGAKYFVIEKEDVWNISSTSLHFLYPDHSIAEDAKIPGDKKEPNTNNTSIVFKLSYGEEDLLMMGDAEEDLEKYLIQTYDGQLDVEVIKAGHHGSATASSQEFLDLTSPSSTIISCGLNNRFGHPSRRVLKRLEREGSGIWRTDLGGDIMMVVKNDQILTNIN